MAERTFNLIVDDKPLSVSVEPEMPLLWVLRDELGIQGPKFGCGVAACGACTVLINGTPMRSCSVSINDVDGPIATIEGLAVGGTLHPVQDAWIAEGVPQCGYCQSGQIMSAVVLLSRIPNPSDADIDAAMAGNLCRCGTYSAIRRAIHKAASQKG